MAWLDGHINFETKSVGDAPGQGSSARQSARRMQQPSLERMRLLAAYLGTPQADLDIVHVTGTNGKGSVVRMVAALIESYGLSVGTYTSPHLERLNERMTAFGEAITDADLADLITVVAIAEEALIDAGGPLGEACSFFELATAGAFRWLGDEAVEAAVIEVGLGGLWDATNVADGRVAVLTNVDLDHTEILGSTRGEILFDKLGIVKPGSTAVLGIGPEDALHDNARAWATERGAAEVLTVGTDFACTANRTAVGGRVLALRTPGAAYDGLYLPLHGAHQGENAARALAAAEAFIGAPLPEDVVSAGFALVRHPGRMEVVGRNPLTVLDGAHNVAGAKAAARTLREDFMVSGELVLVMGLLDGRDAGEMLDALNAHRPDTGALPTKCVVAVAPPSGRAQHPGRLVAAAAERNLVTEMAVSVEQALEIAKAMTDPNDLLLVTGSLYLVGAARTLLRR